MMQMRLKAVSKYSTRMKGCWDPEFEPSVEEIVDYQDIYRRTGFNCVVYCVLVKSGQIANPIIAMDDPVPYCSIRACLCLRIY